MTDLRTAAKQALEALESAVEYDYHGTPLTETHAGFNDAATALKAALAEPVQEPVAWMTVRLNVPIQTTARKDVADEWLKWGEVLPLYTAPPQRVPLTREEAIALWADKSDGPSNGEIVSFARAIERAHGIKE